MAGGIADVLEVVVLAAGAHAALGGGRPGKGALVLPEEHVLELHHARVGEEQRRIVARHEWAGGNDRVALAGKIFQELAADLAAIHLNPVTGDQ